MRFGGGRFWFGNRTARAEQVEHGGGGNEEQRTRHRRVNAMGQAYDNVRWDHLKSAEFQERQRRMPVAWLPMGLCEPHGHIALFGKDTIKAERLCREAARRYGGIVAPTMAWHTHETGYHAPWLAEVMGGVNPRLGALPPHLVLETLLYQLRAIRNAGFGAAIVISGHHGAQADLRMVVDAFTDAFGLPTFIRTNSELVTGDFTGDHAGRYELSQLLAIRPDLVALERAGSLAIDPLGRFAQNPDVSEATAEEGRAILELSLQTLGAAISTLSPKPALVSLSMEEVARVWTSIASRMASWATMNP